MSKDKVIVSKEDGVKVPSKDDSNWLMWSVLKRMPPGDLDDLASFVVTLGTNHFADVLSGMADVIYYQRESDDTTPGEG